MLPSNLSVNRTSIDAQVAGQHNWLTIVCREFARAPPAFADSSPTIFFSRTLVNARRTLSELLANTGERSTLVEFARIRVEFAANWRTVCQKMFKTSTDSGEGGVNFTPNPNLNPNPDPNPNQSKRQKYLQLGLIRANVT
jgi:hypothetical protein